MIAGDVFACEVLRMSYTITQQCAGSISLDVPLLRGISEGSLRLLIRAISGLPVFRGINDVTLDPAMGKVAIEYDPALVDIEDYLSDMSVIVGGIACCVTGPEPGGVMGRRVAALKRQ